MTWRELAELVLEVRHRALERALLLQRRCELLRPVLVLAQGAEELKTTTEPSYKQQAPAVRSSLFPEWANCAVAIAGLAGATVAATAAIFASGGTLALALATYGLSGASVLGSCYDEHGNPVV